MTVKEKKVELIELFYDLVYVYAISRMTLILEEPEGGVPTLTCWPYTSSPPWS
jgi:low temperature requirement protein LtrA